MIAATARCALRTPALRRIQLAWMGASVGGWTFMVALSVYAYGRGGAAAVGLAALARMLPAGLAAPVAGALADRHSRRDVLLVATAGRALAAGLVLVAVAVDAPFAVVLALAAVFTALMTAHRPAQAALLPQIARTPAELAAANVVSNTLDNAGFIVGALVGGALVAATNVEVALTATALAFLLAAALIERIPRDPVPSYRGSPGGHLQELVGGLGAVRGDPELRLVLGVVSLSTLVEGAVDVLVVVCAFALLDLGGAGVGWLNAAWGVGGLAGGAAALMLLGRGRLAAGLGIGGLLIGLSLLALAAFPAVVVAAIALLVLGTGYSLVEVAGTTLLQRSAADEVLARAGAVVESSYWVTNGVGAVLAPLLVAGLGVRVALVVTGACLPLAVLARWAALARLEAGRPVPERIFARMRQLPLLAPVPQGIVENLALGAIEVPVRAGQVVLREGDRGDRFYAIEEGSLEVTRRGSHCAVLEAGDFVGETALLRDLPRNATVTALEDGLLYALERDVFVDTVTGHKRAREAAAAVIAVRTALREPAELDPR